LGLDNEVQAKASSSVTSGASFAPLRNISAYLTFDYQIDYEVSSNLPLATGMATNSFFANVGGSNPDGTPLNVLLPVPAILASNMFTGPGIFSTGLVPYDSRNFVPAVLLGSGGTYNFGSGQSNGVMAGVVPEPASLLSFALIGVVALGPIRRRRK
jgi:hypothetical protein